MPSVKLIRLTLCGVTGMCLKNIHQGKKRTSFLYVGRRKSLSLLH